MQISERSGKIMTKISPKQGKKRAIVQAKFTPH